VQLITAVPAGAQLLLIENYLAPPKVEYSADVTMTGDGDTIAGKVHRAGQKERRELTVAGDTEVLIIRFDRKLAWSLSPEDKIYLESTLDEALGRQPGTEGQPREPQLTLTPGGSETIEGVHATKQSVRGTDVDGTPIEGDVWVSDDGVVLRVDSVVVDQDGGRHRIRTELHHLRVAPQDPKLFEIPPDYKRATQGKLGALDGADAGLRERWEKGSDGVPVESGTIIRTTANALVVRLHDRMPVILTPDDYPACLGHALARGWWHNASTSSQSGRAQLQQVVRKDRREPAPQRARYT
jgi:hypothetical protein